MLCILSREGAELRVSGLFLRLWYRRYCSLERRPRWPPPAWARPLGISDPGGKTADRKAPVEDTRREAEIHLSGSGKG